MTSRMRIWGKMVADRYESIWQYLKAYAKKCRLLYYDTLSI
ncbi:hypothetical protein [Flagellimonas flava]